MQISNAPMNKAKPFFKRIIEIVWNQGCDAGYGEKYIKGCGPFGKGELEGLAWTFYAAGFKKGARLEKLAETFISDEQIHVLAKRSKSYVDLARAIEKMHGIEPSPGGFPLWPRVPKFHGKDPTVE